jgi:hypothetical protein
MTMLSASLYQSAGTWETGVEVVVHLSKVIRGVRRLAGSGCVLLGHLSLTVE